MRSVPKILHFPFAGLSRNLSVRDNTQPSEMRIYGTPLAMNVRGTCTFADRRRGGSRPDFTPPAITTGTIEARFRARRFIADGALWHASRTGNAEDFNQGGDGGDRTRPATGNAALPGRAGTEYITALFAPTNNVLFMATANSLWALLGDPATSNFVMRSPYAGCVSKDAWAFDGTRYYMLSANGLYAFTPEEPPVLISDEVPFDLKGATAAALAYDEGERVLHVVTDTCGSWTYDIGDKAWWPFDASGKSLVAIGPFRTSGRDDEDGILDTLHVVLAEGSADLALEVYPGRTAEVAFAAAKAGTQAEPTASPAFSATVKAGFNNTVRPRVRGAWCVIVLRGTGRWAYETATATCKQLGRLR